MQILFEYLLSVVNHLVPVVFVEPWEAGVRVFMGKWWKRIGPGPHWKTPFLHQIHTVNVKRQIVALPKQTVRTVDGVSLTFSLLLTYSIRDPAKVWIQVQDFDDSIIAMAMAEAAKYVGRETLEGISYGNMTFTIFPIVREQGFKWGCEVHAVDLADLANVQAFRILGDVRQGQVAIIA